MKAAKISANPLKKYAPHIPYFNALSLCSSGKSLTIVANTAALSTESKLSIIINSPMAIIDWPRLSENC